MLPACPSSPIAPSMPTASACTPSRPGTDHWSSSSTAFPSRGTRGATSCRSSLTTATARSPSTSAATGARRRRRRSRSTGCCAWSPTTSPSCRRSAPSSAVVVGHDWGAPIAWNSALLRPDVFRAVAGLSVPFAPAGDVRPSEAFRAMGGDEEFYIEYFQQPGRAEAEIEQDVRSGCSGSTGRRPVTPNDRSPAAERWRPCLAVGSWCDRFTLPRRDAGVAHATTTSTSTPGSSSAPASPAGSTATATSTATGTTCRRSAGGRSRCRRCSSAATATARRSGAPARSSASPPTLPRLHRSLILDGCGHWTQQERAADVNEALVDFLSSSAERPARRLATDERADHDHPPRRLRSGSTPPGRPPRTWRRRSAPASPRPPWPPPSTATRSTSRGHSPTTPASPSSPPTPTPDATCCATRPPT